MTRAEWEKLAADGKLVGAKFYTYQGSCDNGTEYRGVVKAAACTSDGIRLAFDAVWREWNGSGRVNSDGPRAFFYTWAKLEAAEAHEGKMTFGAQTVNGHTTIEIS